jgi:hypothetical protein
MRMIQRALVTTYMGAALQAGKSARKLHEQEPSTVYPMALGDLWSSFHSHMMTFHQQPVL